MELPSNMEIKLLRADFGPRATIGSLSIDGRFECFTLEDVVRDGPKIAGATAIPFGRYELAITWSNRFGRPMPLLLNVPGFSGIRIHSGNTDVDTEGCILLGTAKGDNDLILHSRLAFGIFFPKLQKALSFGKVFITLADGRT